MFFLRRLILSVVLVLVVPSIVFIMSALTPGTVADVVLGANATPLEIAKFNARLGLNHPIYVQYADWISKAVQGNFGVSYVTGSKVLPLVTRELPVTVSLLVGAIVVSTLIGIPLGIISSRRRWHVNVLTDVASVVGLAVPNFIIGLVLIELFAVNIHLLPATGYVTFSASAGGWVRSLIMPVVALGALLTTGVAKQTRDQMLAVSKLEFVRNLRARGSTGASITLKHCLRNAMIPVVTVIGLNVVGAIGAVIFIEQVFALPGMGGGLFTAVSDHDIPVTLCEAFFFTIFVVIANFLVDIGYRLLDPRVRS